MIQLLGLVLISFSITSLVLVPFIDLLYYLRSRFSKIQPSAKNQDTPIHNKLLGNKNMGAPVGGGLLIIPIVSVLSYIVVYLTSFRVTSEIYVLIFTFCAFGLIGLFDDVRKIFSVFSGKYSGLRGRYILILQLICAFFVSILLYYSMGLNNIFLPLFGNVVLGFWYVPIAMFLIVAFSNAYNISDGMDGLSTGLLMICLFAFLVLASTVFDQTLSIFLGVWIGAVVAYLYFNVFPARIILGDAGAFAFGATLAVVGLLSGKVIGLGIIGGVFVIIVSSSLLQIVSKRILKRKILPVAPIHMYFKYIGWEEPKIVMRFWLAGVIFAIFGLWLSLLSR